MRLNSAQYSCPLCQSDNTYSFAGIYKIALENSLSELILERRIRFSGERDKYRFRKLILERTAPPPKPALGAFELFVAVLGGVIGMIVGSVGNDILKVFFGNHFQVLILFFALIGYFKTLHFSYRQTTFKDKVKWSSKIEEWHESQLCLRCGASWQQ